jgi:aromatic-L-amino-acid decarboxylase
MSSNELVGAGISPDRRLELSGAEFARLLDVVAERIAAYVDTLPVQPSADAEGGRAVARSLVEPLPEQGEALSAVLDLVFDRAVPKGYNTAGPGYLAYIPGGGVLHAALGGLIADAVNRYVGVWVAAPGLAQLEVNVVRWFSDIVGYGGRARGFLTSGGSLANFSAIVTARRTLLPDDFLKGTIYVSDQVHHSVQKAAMLAGFPEDNVRVVPSDSAFRIRIDELGAGVERDRRAGWMPFMVVASAGTTNTGAVDDLSALADLAEREDLWLHVDAAYGGFFLLTDRGRQVMRGIERSHSATLDPHKSLFLPYGTGSLVVREGDALERAHTTHADYMPPMQEDEDLVDFCQISPELSRPFRGLRTWLPIKLLGIGPFRDNLDEKLDLALWAERELRTVEHIEIVAEPQLSILAFRLVPTGPDREGLNRLNRDFIARINARRRVYLTGTMVSGDFVLRICVLSFRTHQDRMRACLEDIRAVAAEVSSSV